MRTGVGEPSTNAAGGSGLDPDISPAYARLQVYRVAERDDLPVARVREPVDEHTEGRTPGFTGDPRVNVLELDTAPREPTGR